MQSSLIAIFYSVSQWMLTPVMIILLGAMMYLIVVSGMTGRMALDRWIRGRAWRRFMESLRSSKVTANQWHDWGAVGLPGWFATRCHGEAGNQAIRLRLPEAELIANRFLSKLQVMIRVGPMLGLIGTLLPLGPALQELSGEHLARVGENLNIAFTTTVFGIAIGGLAYALHVIHRTWYERDLNDMECVATLLGDVRNGN